MKTFFQARSVANTLTSGSQSYSSWYRFDAASRMTQATLSLNGTVDHVLDYGVAGTGTACAGFTLAAGAGGATSLGGCTAVTTALAGCTGCAAGRTGAAVTGGVAGGNGKA